MGALLLALSDLILFHLAIAMHPVQTSTPEITFADGKQIPKSEIAISLVTLVIFLQLFPLFLQHVHVRIELLLVILLNIFERFF